MRKTSTKRNPRVQGVKSLGLDNNENESVELTAEEQSDKFMSDYLMRVQPLSTYDTYFQSSAKSDSHILKEVKQFHKQLVIHGTWTDNKYVKVLDEVFRDNIILNIVTLDNKGRQFDRNTTQSRRR